MKFTHETFGNRETILKFADHVVAVAITVDATGVVANADGKKIVPAGTLIGCNTGGKVLLENLDTQKGTAATVTDVDSTTNVEGILRKDVDVTYGDAQGSLIIHGYIDLNKLPTTDKTNAKKTFVKAAIPQIKFLG